MYFCQVEVKCSTVHQRRELPVYFCQLGRSKEQYSTPKERATCVLLSGRSIVNHGGAIQVQVQCTLYEHQCHLIFSFIRLSTESTEYIVGFKPNATKMTAHHMLLYGCDEPGRIKCPILCFNTMNYQPSLKNGSDQLFVYKGIDR